MFIQKLDLDSTKSYQTTTTIENLVENLQLSFNHIPIITPYATKSFSEDQINDELKKEKSSITLTIPVYMTFKDRFDSSHVVIENYDILESFGYTVDSLDKPVIVNEGNADFEKIKLCRFFVKAEDTDRYVALFIISKLFGLSIVTRDVERMNVFCQVFKLDCVIYDVNDDVKNVDTDALVLFDCYKEIACERIFLIGRKSMGMEKLELDVKEAGKFKYRIHNVISDMKGYAFRRYGRFDFEKYSKIDQ